MTASTQTNTSSFPWEKWEQLPKEEREAEMNEALKNNNQTEVWRQQIINRGGDLDDPHLNPEARKFHQESVTKERVMHYLERQLMLRL